MNNEEEVITYEKLKIYLRMKSKVHIVLFNNRFYNGPIVQVNKFSIIINDSVLGNLPVFLTEIKKVEPFTKPIELREMK